jgi:hypothetical protein
VSEVKQYVMEYFNYEGWHPDVKDDAWSYANHATVTVVLAHDYTSLAAENARLERERAMWERQCDEWMVMAERHAKERDEARATIARQAGEIERLKTGDRPCIYAIVQQNGFVLVRATHLTDVGMRLHYVESIPALRPVAAGEEK